MKTISLYVLLLMSSALIAQSSWKSDGSHSKVGFTITHLGISEVDGHFGDFEITAEANDEFKNPSFNVSIKTESIDTDNERRDNHLRSADYFEAETYPTIEFKSTAVESTGDNTFKVTGDLSMHGVTKTVELNGKVNGVITNQRSQKLKAGLKLTGTINRLDFNVGEETMTLGDDVELTINLEMAQQ